MSTQLRHSGSDVQELLDKMQYALDNTSTCSPALSDVTFNGENITFSNTISANISGNAATATFATSATKDGDGNVINSTYLKLSGGTMTGNLTVPTIIGNLTGNVTGNCSGSSGSCTGNAATATVAESCSGNSATASVVLGNYTGSGGQQPPNYFGTKRVGFRMMNNTVNGNSAYKDWIISDCYSGNDVGGAVAFGLNRSALGAYIMGSDAARTEWNRKAELLGTHNVKDYVIEQGVVGRTGSTNTNWYYRRWNNGTSECWTIATCANITSWSVWGNIYEANVGSYWNYPANLFITQPTLLATPFLNGSGFCGVEFYENSSASTYATRTPYMYVLRGATGGASTPTLQLYAIGRWK